jgi:hypothetical protein
MPRRGSEPSQTPKAVYMRRYNRGEITLTRPPLTMAEVKDIQGLLAAGRLSLGMIGQLTNRSRDTVKRVRDGFVPTRKQRPNIYDDQGKQMPGPKPFKCVCEEFGCWTCMNRERSRIER